LGWRLGIAHEEADGVSIVTLAGRISHQSAPALAAAIARLADRAGARLVVDLALVDYMSSAGVEVVAAAEAGLADRNGAVVLAVVTDPVRTVLELAGLSRIPSAPSRDEAIALARR